MDIPDFSASVRPVGYSEVIFRVKSRATCYNMTNWLGKRAVSHNSKGKIQ